MAEHDLFLWPIPTDPDVGDVRLRDPTTTGAPAGDVTVTAAQALAGVSNAASVAVTIAATAAQTLAGIGNASNIDVVVSATAAQALAGITGATNIDVVVGISAAQQLADTINATAVEVVAAGAVTVTAAQTLAGITQSTAVNVVRISDADDDHDYFRVRRLRASRESKKAAEITQWLASLPKRVADVLTPPKPARKRRLVHVRKPDAATPAAFEPIVVVSPKPWHAAPHDQIVIAAPIPPTKVEIAVASYRQSREARVARAAANYHDAKIKKSVRAYRMSKAVLAYQHSTQAV